MHNKCMLHQPLCGLDSFSVRSSLTTKLPQMQALALNMMNEALLIDMSGIMDEETFHEYISTKLNFPDYYGYNLDSFWDCITHEEQSSMPKILKVEGLAALNNFIPELHCGFVGCLRDYVKEYPDRSVLFYQDSPSGEGIEFEDE